MEMKPLLPPIVVNGVTIPAERIAAEAQNHPAPKGKPGQAWKAAARALALREILLQEARARGIAPEPAELAPGQWETEEEAMIRQLLETAIRPEPADEFALRALYDGAPERFRAPSLYEAAHILIAAPAGDAAARAVARDTALALLDELRRVPRRFAELAAQNSACSSRQNGGLLGQLSSGDTVPEFEAALAGMEEGEISAQPVETRYGFHLIRLDAKARGAILPFETVLPHLREAREKAAWVVASRTFTAELVARAEVSGVSLAAEAERKDR
ncbi:peptidylprolyl isomerase [Paracoccus simplex]|uniref:Parvulin-like PPIase n=2 Tax=Paracoccus simplex TaxID=2086346 RepID=A0ABV7RZ97_9RHOB